MLFCYAKFAKSPKNAPKGTLFGCPDPLKLRKKATKLMQEASQKRCNKQNAHKIDMGTKMTRSNLPKSLALEELFKGNFGSFFEAASGRPTDPPNHNKIEKNTISESLCSCTSAFVAAYALSSKENSWRESLQQFSPCAVPAEP